MATTMNPVATSNERAVAEADHLWTDDMVDKKMNESS